MISAITRNQQKLSFAYDKTYQLTAELGRYLTNLLGGALATATVSNQFCYDAAGNRISSVGAGSVPRIWLHTADNQLTTICWNAASITLRGRLDNAWTADWVKVKHHMALQWTPAVVRCERGQPVRWEARDVPVSVTLPASFDVQAHTPDSQTVNDTVPYTKINGSPGSIAYACDANGNRTEKWTNSLLAARYFYDTDNQLLGISFNNDQDYTDAADYAYAYDPFGRRISATEDGVTRYFAHDGLDSITELDASANVTKWCLRGSGLGGGIADIIAEVSPTTTNYFCYNHRGDVVTLTRPDGQVTNRFEYTAFGQPLDERPPMNAERALRFSSKEHDTRSGLSYYGFRYYDADSGRWLTKDKNAPSSYLKLYCFCLNGSMNYFDSRGLYEEYLGGYFAFGDFSGWKDVEAILGKRECRPISGFYQHCVNSCSMNRMAAGPLITFSAAAIVGGDSVFSSSSYNATVNGIGEPHRANITGIGNSYKFWGKCTSLCKASTLKRIKDVCCPYTDGDKPWMHKNDPGCCPP